jgi:hypothetical protein
MADAEDLKSSGDFSSCGFDSHPGHKYLQCLLSPDAFLNSLLQRGHEEELSAMVCFRKLTPLYNRALEPGMML